MPHLTKEMVERVLGREAVDDRMVVAIIETGASEQELGETYNLYVRGDDLAIELGHPPSSRVADLRELLTQLEPASDEEGLGR